MRKCVFNSLFEHRVLCSNIKLFVQTKSYMFKQIHVFVQTYNSLFEQIVLCSNKELKTHFRMSSPGLRTKYCYFERNKCRWIRVATSIVVYKHITTYDIRHNEKY